MGITARVHPEARLAPIDVRHALQLFHAGLGEPDESFAGIEFPGGGGGHGVEVREHPLIAGIRGDALVREVDALVEVLLDARDEQGAQHQGVIARRG